MKQIYFPALYLIAATVAGQALAQDTGVPATEIPIQDRVATAIATDTALPAETLAKEGAAPAPAAVEAEDTVEAVSQDVGAEEVVVENATDVPASDALDLAEIAASDPALDVRTDASGEVEAMVMLSDVLFAFDDATLADDAIVVLQGLAPKLEGAVALEITGHTDSRGDARYNIDLGQRRAEAVRNWLVANSALTDDMVTARGVGEAEPTAANRAEDGSDNPEGRALNRRVELSLPDAT